MEIWEGIQRIAKELSLNTSRIIAFPYLLFLMLCFLYWFNFTTIPKQWFVSISNEPSLHTIGILSIIITVISFRNAASRTNFIYHLSQIIKKEPKSEGILKLIQPNLTEKDFVKSLMEWSKDAHEIYIFGGSANFLKDNSPTNDLEFEELKKLGKKCKLLIKRNFTANIDKLWELTKSGVEIRTYPDGDLHIRGRLKKDSFGTQSYLCSKKNGKYTTQSIPLLEVSKLLLKSFCKLFEKGGNPFIRCIMFDKGGVWCENIDSEWIVNDGVRKLANCLDRKGYIVIIHSNCSPVVGQSLIKEKTFFNGFRLFFSYEMSSKKPDVRFYKEILNKLHLKPFQCVFIDDSFDNTDTAENLDMKTIKVPPNPNDKHIIIAEELENLQVRIVNKCFE